MKITNINITHFSNEGWTGYFYLTIKAKQKRIFVCSTGKTLPELFTNLATASELAVKNKHTLVEHCSSLKLTESLKSYTDKLFDKHYQSIH